jgi:hypothetical protein
MGHDVEGVAILKRLLLYVCQYGRIAVANQRRAYFGVGGAYASAGSQ